MQTDYFVSPHSIVRQIWGKSDTILFIFAGSAAEFAVNKSVDWLYFTGRLPADPIGRLFSTVRYAREIIFSDQEDALRAIDSIAKIHAAVEKKRGASIPEWAYRDVLFMLIDYSIRSFEIMERSLTIEEKNEVFDVFTRVGTRMGIKDLPENFPDWEVRRVQHMQQNMAHSHYTTPLFGQYRKFLGAMRYRILIETQILVVPEQVRTLLGYRRFSYLGPLLGSYKLSRKLQLDGLMKAMIQPAEYRKELKALDTYDPDDKRTTGKVRRCPFAHQPASVPVKTD